MARTDRRITVHECFFAEQANKIRSAISEISQKDSLSAVDTKAIRIMTEVYDSLINPVSGNYKKQAD